MATKKYTKKNTKNKKIENKPEDKPEDKPEKQQKTTKIKKTHIIITIILLGIIAILLIQPTQEKTDEYQFYNGYEFTRSTENENVWKTNISIGQTETEVEFWHHPLNLENITYNTDINQYLYLAQISEAKATISYTKEVLEKQTGHLSMAGYDLSRILRSFLGFNVSVAAEDLEEYENITCEDATKNNFVLIFKQGELRAESKPYCAILYFDEPSDATKITSKLIYNVLGIME